MREKRKIYKYIVVDFYEDIAGDIIYRSDSYNDCTHYATQFECETDGECDLVVMKVKTDNDGTMGYTPVW